jgi:hypothetical protein
MTSPETPLQQRTFAKLADAARAEGLQIICEANLNSTRVELFDAFLMTG